MANRSRRTASSPLNSSGEWRGAWPMNIELDDPTRPDVLALLEEHLQSMHALSPPESVHALDVAGLLKPGIHFWSVRDGDALLAIGALQELDPSHAEIKSIRTPQAQRRRGAGRLMLAHLLDQSRQRGYERVSLETGSMEAFQPARSLYESFGFEYCGPFGDYELDPHSVFMTLSLRVAV